MKRAFRNWIIGDNNFIESWNEYRQIMLSAQFSVISLIALIINIYLESHSHNPAAFIVLHIAFILILFTLLLHRINLHCPAKVLLFLTLNGIIFLIGCSESITTGAFIFLIPLGLGTFSVFNYSQRKLAVLLVASSGILFGLALTGKISVLPFRTYTSSEIESIQLLNFGISFIVSVIVVYLLIRISHHNARSLKKTNDQLTKLNEDLDRFVYSTSHDLRAPLLSVKGLLELMQTASPDEQKKYIQLMSKRMDSLDAFITDIANYSRNNRLEITKENVNVAELADDIWESLRYNPEAHGIEFKNEIPNNLVVINDSRRMKVVLANIIGNAIRYHDRHKDKKYIRLYHQVTDSSFSLHIEDNGLGIAPELHEKIFDMFFRGNEKSQGTGLGLFIVKETLDKLSGQINLQSAPSQGTTFSIMFPM